MENNYVAAVDLGTSKVVIAVARRAEKNKVEIIALKEQPSKGIVRGELKNIEQTHNAILEAKSQIEEELDIQISDVYVGISGKHIKCMNTSGYVFVSNAANGNSEVTAQDVKRLTEDMYGYSMPNGQSIITVLPQIYKLDNEQGITEPIGLEGRRLEAQFNIIAGEDSAIDRVKRCFKRSGLNVSGITLPPIASSYALLNDDEKELGVAVVDIGAGTTDLCIYHDKVIRHIAVLAVGGNEINTDIKSYGILDRHLEELKIVHGEAIEAKAPEQRFIKIPPVNPGQAHKEISSKTLAKIIEERLKDIVEFVSAQIEKCGYKGKLGAGIVLTGGSSMLKNIEPLFRKLSGYEVRLGTANQHLTQESIEKVAQPKYTTIAGILIEAILSGKVSNIEIANNETQPEELENQDYGSIYDNPENYYSEEDPTELQNQEQISSETRKPKRGVWGLFKRTIGSAGKIFESDEIDSDDNY